MVWFLGAKISSIFMNNIEYFIQMFHIMGLFIIFIIFCLFLQEMVHCTSIGISRPLPPSSVDVGGVGIKYRLRHISCPMAPLKAVPIRGLALVIIDMQNDFVSWSQNAQAIVPALAKVLSAFRANGLPVFHVIRHYSEDGSDVEGPRVETFLKKPFVVAGTPGAEIVPQLRPWKDEAVIIKKRWSAFFGTDLLRLLRAKAIDTIVVGGIYTPNCVRTTVFDAISHDLDVISLVDGTASEDRDIQDANILDMVNIGVRVMACDDLLKVVDWKAKT